MKKKLLLFGSFGAMLLSAALLIMPANGQSLKCTTCTKIVDGGIAVEVAACKNTGIDGCFCPLPPPLQSNNCSLPSAEKTNH